MVKWCNYTKYKCYHIRKLYCSGNKCKRMSECSISSHHSNSKCFTGNSNYYSRRSDNFLCRWKCNLNIKCRNKLPLVKWSDYHRSINVTTAGSYTVQVTNANGCQSAVSAATVVNVNALPVVNAGTDATIPNGTSTTINATVTGTGPFTYSWSPSAQLVNALIEDPTTVNLTTTTVFTLTATSTTTSCSNTDAVTITISGGPLSSTPTATPGTICAGANVQLHAIASGGSGSYTYTWTSTPVGFTSSIADPIANPSVTTTYHVAVFDGFTTVNSQVTVTVNALPATPTITAGGPTTFCAGGSVTLTSSAGTSYLWSNGATTAKYKCYHSRKLYSKGNQCKRMSECSISSHSSNSKCFTGNTNYYSRRSDNFLCRWKCNLNLKCRNKLLMVNRSNHTKYKCYNSRKLYSSGNKCKRMSECTISSHNSNSKCFTGNTNYYSWRSNNFLCRWQV